MELMGRGLIRKLVELQKWCQKSLWLHSVSQADHSRYLHLPLIQLKDVEGTSEKWPWMWQKQNENKTFLMKLQIPGFSPQR